MKIKKSIIFLVSVLILNLGIWVIGLFNKQEEISLDSEKVICEVTPGPMSQEYKS